MRARLTCGKILSTPCTIKCPFLRIKQETLTTANHDPVLTINGERMQSLLDSHELDDQSCARLRDDVGNKRRSLEKSGDFQYLDKLCSDGFHRWMPEDILQLGTALRSSNSVNWKYGSSPRDS